jgi:hypothetical protein
VITIAIALTVGRVAIAMYLKGCGGNRMADKRNICIRPVWFVMTIGDWDEHKECQSMLYYGVFESQMEAVHAANKIGDGYVFQSQHVTQPVDRNSDS